MLKSNTSKTRSTSQKSIANTKPIETFLQSDSPYKNCVSEINKIEPKEDDSDDFKTPVAIKKSLKLSKPLCKKNKSIVKPTKKTKKINNLKTTEDNFENSDVNQDDLQMALALSKSSFETENPSSHNERAMTYSLDITENSNLGSVLERFGFNSNKTKLRSNKPKNCSVGNSYIGQTNKKRKNGKFRYVTPTLSTRTDEDREALITTKISFILRHIESSTDSARTEPVVEIFSEQLKQYYCESKIISLNFLSHNELLEQTYLVKSLNLPLSESCCGCLLKNWKDIPGRDESPDRSCGTPTEMNIDGRSASNADGPGTYEEEKFRSQNCVSPDLFDSDVEFLSDEHNMSLNTNGNEMSATSRIYRNNTDENNINLHTNECEMVVTSTTYKSNIGIEHFETISDDSLISPEKANRLANNTSNKKSPVNSGKKSSTSKNTHRKNDDINNPPSTDSEETLKESNGQNCSIVPNRNHCGSSLNLEENCNAASQSAGNLMNPDTSENFRETSPTFIEKSSNQDSLLHDVQKQDSRRVSLNNTGNLNITDYVTELLNKRNSELILIEEGPKELEHEYQCDSSSSQSQITNSQESIVISDEELNYSSRKSKDSKFYDFCSSDDDDESEETEIIIINDVNDIHTKLKEKYSQKVVPLDAEEAPSDNESLRCESEGTSSEVPQRNKEEQIISSPELYNAIQTTQSTSSTNGVATPKTMIIKTKDITPMANYDEMNSPQVIVELDKFGLKPLKRRRGIQLLKYIYESTHPIVEIPAVDKSQGDEQLIKRRRIEDKENIKSSQRNSVVNIIGDLLLQNEKQGDLIFERKISKKIPSCAIPLQIVWYNFISSNPELRKNILLYEPLQLEVIHSMLKDQSDCKFKLEDLINFLDKKCITFRTSQCQKQKQCI